MSVSPSPSSRVSPLPQLDGRVGPRDPLLVVGVQQHRAVEARRPVGHPRVVVRVRDRDRRQPAAALDLRGRLVVEARGAVPHHEALAERDEQRALADRQRTARCRRRSARRPRAARCDGSARAPRASSSAGRPRGRTGARPSQIGQCVGRRVRRRGTGRRRWRRRSGAWSSKPAKSARGEAGDPDQDGHRGDRALRRLALAEHAGAQQRDDDDRRLAPGATTVTGASVSATSTRM